MALLATQHPSTTGFDSTYSAVTVTAGDTFRNTGKEFIHVINGGGGATVVTVDSPTTCSFGIAANAAHDLTVSVPAGEDRMIGPFNKERFNSSTDIVTFICSVVTTVTAAIFASA